MINKHCGIYQGTTCLSVATSGSDGQQAVAMFFHVLFVVVLVQVIYLVP